MPCNLLIFSSAEKRSFFVSNRLSSYVCDNIANWANKE
jgi:hypothetical protein